MTKLYHGTTKSIANKILSEKRFVESRNKYDWLGPGVYFYQDSPEKALFWAEEFAIAKKFPNEAAAVIEVQLSLAETLDLTRAKGLVALQQFSSKLARKSKTQSNPILRTYEGIRKKIFSGLVIEGDDFVGKNVDDYELIVDLIAVLREKTSFNYNGIRAAFWEGQEIRKGSYFFDHTNVQVCMLGKGNPEESDATRSVSFDSLPLLEEPRLISTREMSSAKRAKQMLRPNI